MIQDLNGIKECRAENPAKRRRRRGEHPENNRYSKTGTDPDGGKGGAPAYRSAERIHRQTKSNQQQSVKGQSSALIARQIFSGVAGILISRTP